MEESQDQPLSDKGEKNGNKKRSSIPNSFLPRRTVKDVIPIAKAIYENFAGNATPWDTIASIIKVGAKSPNMKYLIWSAESYGIILKEDEASYKLTELGRKTIAPTFLGEDKEAIRKAILTPTLLSKFYLDYDKHPLPKEEFFPNVLERNYDIPRDRVQEVIDLIISNAEFANIIQIDSTGSTSFINLNGNTKLDVAIDHNVVEEAETSYVAEDAVLKTLPKTKGFENVCFVVSPIGEETSEFRKHANTILKHLIQPVAESFNLKVVRSDSIDKSGLITQQILEHLVNAPFCIADLSFNNPNVFYELGVRHMSQLPTIQIIRKGDKIPFDVSQGRTITVDLSDIYTIMDRFESARRELTDHLTAITKSGNSEIAEDNPIKIYLPNVKITISKI